MTFDHRPILAALTSHAAKLPAIQRLTRHEPKNAPGTGVTWALFFGGMTGIQSSGLDATSARVEYIARFYMPMRTEPQDEIDPRVLDAVNALFAEYHGGFSLGALARCIDLLGAYGAPLGAQGGYLDLDKVMFRVADVVVPVIVNDAWTQVS